MPFTTTPLQIEQADFSAGFSPDGDEVSQDPNALRDTWNLLLDTATHALETRAGFERVVELTTDTGYRVVSINKYWKAGSRQLIVAITNDLNAVDNVRILLVEPLNSWTVTELSDGATNWSRPSSAHWGVTVDNVFYGGSRGNEMYSWDGSTFDNTAATGNWKTAVNDVGVSVTEATEYAKDYAYKGTEKVFYGGNVYTPARSNRFDRWGSIDSDDSFRKGDKVTNTISGWGYPTSYVCIKAHDPSAATTEPGVGATWQTYWRKLQLPLPTDADGNTNTKSWDFVIIAPETDVAVWFANRLWLVDAQNGTRMAYSAPLKPVRGEDIGDTEFDPKDFTPGNDLRGPGGGWWDFTTGHDNARITAATTYDQYLVVFRAHATWVLSGHSDTSFTSRKLEGLHGCLSSTAHVEHHGLLYFAGEDNIYITDGTSVEPVPGMERIREWYRARIDANQADASPFALDMWSFGDFVWLSMPVDGSTSEDGDFVTLAYHPPTQSFWKTDLPAQCHAKRNIDGVQQLYFANVGTYGNQGTPFLCQYTGDTDDELDAGDTEDEVYWYLYTSWWSFALHRQQRRIRRVWALVKNLTALDTPYTIGVLRDWDPDTEADTVRTVSGEVPTHIEGAVTADCHAIKFFLDGDGRSQVSGLAVDTEYRRTRYHVN